MTKDKKLEISNTLFRLLFKDDKQEKFPIDIRQFTKTLEKWYKAHEEEDKTNGKTLNSFGNSKYTIEIYRFWWHFFCDGEDDLIGLQDRYLNFYSGYEKELNDEESQTNRLDFT